MKLRSRRPRKRKEDSAAGNELSEVWLFESKSSGFKEIISLEVPASLLFGYRIQTRAVDRYGVAKRLRRRLKQQELTKVNQPGGFQT
jgi:hypothetical protein